MNRYPRWKFFLLMAVLLVCGLYALPNLYPDAPAIQVSSSTAGGQLTPEVARKVLAALDEAGLAHDAGEFAGGSWLVRMESNADQLRAQQLARQALGDGYVVALNLAQTTPGWLRAIGASPMNLGLDLRGGVHFLIQVDTRAAILQRLEAWSGEVRLILRDGGVRYRAVETAQRTRPDGVEEYVINVRLAAGASADTAAGLITERLREFTLRREDNGDLTLVLTQAAITEIENYAVDQNRTSLGNRVNELGVGEPVVQRQGRDRIVVQLPGVQDAAQARRILGRTATVEFRLVAQDVDAARARTGIAPPGTEIFPFKGGGAPVVLERQAIVTGDEVTNARMGFDENGVPEVNITLGSAGARQMQRVTSQNVGNPMAVLFIETRTEPGPDGSGQRTTVDRQVINVATIRDVLSSRFRIMGLDSAAEAAELALLLRSGSLAAPMSIVEERTIGPSLGADNIRAGLNSMIVGMALVLVFMAVWYKGFGLIANIALLGNLVIIIGILSMIPGATLTLPGIAGIVLTVGMAVDANVLIFEQIRAWLKKGMAPLQAIEAGYERAFTTIVDANITTIIAAVILFAAGTGSVQGFAVTLFIGILTSMFTAIVGTRAIIGLVYGRGPAPAKLSI